MARVFTIFCNLVQTKISFIRTKIRVSQFTRAIVERASNETLIRAFCGSFIRMACERGSLEFFLILRSMGLQLELRSSHSKIWHTFSFEKELIRSNEIFNFSVPNFQTSIDSLFWLGKHRNWKMFMKYKVVVLWINFLTPSRLASSDVEIKWYDCFTPIQS